MTEGDTLTLNASLTPADSKDAITYTSSNTSIATVSSSGKSNRRKCRKDHTLLLNAASGVSTIVAIKVNKKSSSGYS